MGCPYYCDCENCYPCPKYQAEKEKERQNRLRTSLEYRHREGNKYYTGSINRGG